MNKILLIYTNLFKAFGPQGWWPLTTKGFHSKHHSGRPITDKNKFEIIIGAILTQNTNWKNVEKALYNLSKDGLVDIKKISKVTTKKLGLLIRPAGYYNQKAERLKIIALYFIKNYKSKINNFSKKDLAEIREELLKIKGIGPETADSIILYALEKPIFVIDAYTKRIFERIGYQAKGYDDWQKLFMDNLNNDVQLFKEYHALIVEQAKRYCKIKPECKGCNLKKICRYA